MNISKLFLPVACVLALAACTPAAPKQSTPPPVPVPSTSTGKKHNEMVHVTNWAFTPASGELRAKQGEDFTVTLMGMQGNHGFAIPELGVNAAIPQGENVTVTIPTDKPGTYTYFCNVSCGPGHADMEGTLVIE